MQSGSFRPYTLRHDTLGVVNRINALAEHFRAQNHKVIFIQHDGSKENVFLPGTEDWQILPELVQKPGDIFISKTANDAFYKTNLQATLEAHNIQELYITGCATDFCVDTTLKSALNKDYKITVIEDGHTTANRPYISAENLIQHHNWLWADMTPTQHKTRVLKTTTVLQSEFNIH